MKGALVAPSNVFSKFELICPIDGTTSVQFINKVEFIIWNLAETLKQSQFFKREIEKILGQKFWQFDKNCV